jgi:hypothetical protein
VCWCIILMSLAPTSSTETLASHYAETYDELVADVSACTTLESLVCGKGMPKPPKPRARRRMGAGRGAPMQTKGTPFDTYERVSVVVKACRLERKRARQVEQEVDTSDETLCMNTRFTDSVALSNYTPFLHYVPRLVNIVRALTPPFSVHGAAPYPVACPVRLRSAESRSRLTPRTTTLFAGDACRGGSGCRLWADAATRLVPHSGAMQRSLLCQQALCRRAGMQTLTHNHLVLFLSQAHTCVVVLLAACLHASALPCLGFPHRPAGRDRCVLLFTARLYTRTC